MEFYKDKKVVITGGAGFIGSHLARILVWAGAQVTVLDDYSRPDPSVRPMYPDPLIDHEIIQTDCTDAPWLRAFFRGTDVIFNLAANVAGVIYNADNNSYMFRSNANLQTSPVVAAAFKGVPYFLQVSSVCVYDPELNHPALENNGHVGEPHQANSGYAWAKRMGERVATWQQDRFEKIVTVRPSNVYGPRDWFDDKAHVVPALIRKVHEATNHVVLNGSGDEVRELVYVQDTAQAMAHAMAHGQTGEAYNIGSGKVYTMYNLLLAIMKVMGKEDLAITKTPLAVSGDPLRWCDWGKLRATGWQPIELSLTRNLERTVEYFYDMEKRNEL